MDLSGRNFRPAVVINEKKPMNLSSDLEELLEIGWTRDLNDREQARLRRLLADNPAWEPAWRENLQVVAGIRRLPQEVVSADFTKRVMAKVEARDPRPAHAVSSNRNWSWGWMPRWGLAAALFLLVAVGGYVLWHSESSRMVSNLSDVTRSGAAPTLEELRYFETIQSLGQVPVNVDWDLIALAEPASQ